jgi:hypothetical protein
MNSEMETVWKEAVMVLRRHFLAHPCDAEKDNVQSECNDLDSNQPPLYERPERYPYTNLLCPFLESVLSIILST